MRRIALGLTALVALLAACTVAPPAGPGPKRTTAPTTRGSAGPADGDASAAPTSRPPASAGILASPSAPAREAARLARPAEPVKVVAGRVLVDANYMVAAGAGNILSHNGGLIVAAGAGNVIVNNSGNLVAAGAGNFALLQAASPSPVASPSPTTPAPGTQLPAAGMELRARSLKDGKPLSLGMGPGGEPVYAVYTNAEGAYEVFLPDSEAGNVLLEARVPADDDPRLAIDLLADTRKVPASPAPGEAAAFGTVMNEENAIATQFIRTCLIGRFVEVCQRPDIEAIVDNWGVSPEARKVVRDFVDVFRPLSIETGLVDAPPAEAEKVARRVMDLLLAQASFDDARVLPGAVQEWVAPEVAPPAVDEIVAVIARSRDAMAARLKEDPAYLSKWTFTSERVPGFKPAMPSDPARFIVDAYLSQSGGNNIKDVHDVLAWAGAEKPLAGEANSPVVRLNAGSVGLTTYVCLFAVNDPVVRAGSEQVFREWKAGWAGAAAAPAASPAP